MFPSISAPPLLFHSVQLYSSCQTLSGTLALPCTDWYHADIGEQTHTPHMHKTLLAVTALPLSQVLFDIVNYMLWVDSWCLCNYPRLHSGIKSEWGWEKFIKRTYLNSGICLQNSMRPSGPAASWLALWELVFFLLLFFFWLAEYSLTENCLRIFKWGAQLCLKVIKKWKLSSRVAWESIVSSSCIVQCYLGKHFRDLPAAFHFSPLKVWRRTPKISPSGSSICPVI